MNVLLVAAKRSRYTGEWITAPFQGLLSLAAVLRAGAFHETRGLSVSVVDEQLQLLENGHETAADWLQRYTPDVVGVQVCTSSLKNGLNLLAVVNRQFPHALKVLGGPGVASGAEKVLLQGAVDLVVLGEGEVTFSEVVHSFGTKGHSAWSSIPGIAYVRDDSVPVRTAKREPLSNLDALPFPARDLVDMDTYRRISHGRGGNLITSRGCSYACAYCYSKHQWGVGQRRYSVRRAVDEIQSMVEDYGISRIRIEDDDFMESQPWLEDFCNSLIERHLSSRIEWEAKARPDHMNLELLTLMRTSGCFRLLMGVETLDPRLLVRLSRPLQIAQLERALDLLRQTGIGVQATLILGIPGETDQAMRYTLSWLNQRLTQKHDITSPCFFVPFYTEIADAMRRKLPFTIEVSDTDRYTGHIPVVSSPACSLDELLALYEDMQADRRGIYDRIAHLAQQDEVYQRMGSLW
ncbi:MAG TPA: radical SAM protein [Bryobacteraceae bacterium]|nr:radical SAM protein [Bryobacteraceae bacterium]